MDWILLMKISAVVMSWAAVIWIAISYKEFLGGRFKEFVGSLFISMFSFACLVTMLNVEIFVTVGELPSSINLVATVTALLFIISVSILDGLLKTFGIGKIKRKFNKSNTPP